MRWNKLRAYGFPVFLLFLLAVSLLLFLNDLLQRPDVQRFLLDRASRALGVRLRAGAVRLDVGRGLGIRAQDVRAWTADGSESVQASALEVGLDGGALIQGRILPSRFHLESPRVILDLGKAKGPRVQEPGFAVAPGTILGRLSALGPVSVAGGEFRISGAPFHLRDLSFALTPREQKGLRIFGFHGRGTWVRGKEHAAFSVTGNLTPGPGFSVQETKGDLSIKVRDLPAAWLDPVAPFGITGGRVSGALDLKGSLGGTLEGRGTLSLGNFSFFISAGNGKKDYHFSRAGLAFEVAREGERISFARLELRTGGTAVHAALDLNVKDLHNPRIALALRHPPMDFQTFQTLMPTPLLPRAVERDYVSLFQSARVEIRALRLKGTLRQLSHLDRPPNRDGFSLDLRMEKGLALEGRGGIPVQDVAGTLVIEGGGLKLAGVSGRFGQSQFRKGSLHISDLFGKPSRFSVEVEGDCRLEDLLRQAKMPHVPGSIRGILGKIDHATGRLRGRFKGDFQGNSIPWFREGLFRLDHARFFQESFFYPLTLERATVRVRDQGVCEFEGNGDWGESRLRFSGTTASRFQPQKVKVSGEAQLHQVWTRFFSTVPGTISCEGPRPFSVTVTRAAGGWEARGAIDLSGTGFSWQGVSVSLPPENRPLRFDLKVEKGKVDFRSLRWSQGEGWAEAKGAYDTKQGRLGPFQVRVKDFHLDHDVKWRGAKTRHIRGYLSGELEVGPGNSPGVSSLRARIFSRGISVEKEEGGASWKLDALEARISGKKISLLSLEVSPGGNPLRITGTLEGWRGLRGALQIQGEETDLAGLLYPGGNWGSSSGRLLEGSRVSIRAVFHKGRWKGMRFDSLEAEGKWEPGALVIKRLFAKAPHWRLRGHGQVGSSSYPRTTLSCHLRMKGQPLGELLGALGVERPYVEGRCTAEVLISTKGTGKQELLSRLSGTGVLLLEEGRLRESGVMIKILDALSLRNLFKERPADLSKEGLYYESISGSFYLDRGALYASDVMMRSPVFNAAAKGKVDLGRGRLRFDIGTQPLGTIDTLLSVIPVVGYILTGKEQSVLVYYFRVDGSLTDPDVRYVPLKNWGTGTVDFFKRIFFTPRRLLRKLTDMVNSPYVKDPTGKSPEE